MAEQPSKRPPPSLKIKCKSATLDEFLAQFGQDIARRGVFVKTKSPLANGTALRFEYLLANASPAFAGVGKVVWRRESGGELPAGMGIQFIDLSDPSRQLVERVATMREGMVSRFDQQNGAEVDPAALRAGGTAERTTPTPPAAPATAKPALPRGLVSSASTRPPRSPGTPAAGLFRQSPAPAEPVTAARASRSPIPGAPSSWRPAAPGSLPSPPAPRTPAPEPAATTTPKADTAAPPLRAPPSSSPPPAQPTGAGEAAPTTTSTPQPVGSAPPPLPSRREPAAIETTGGDAGPGVAPRPAATLDDDFQARPAIVDDEESLERGSLLPMSSLDDGSFEDADDLGFDDDAGEEDSSPRPSAAPASFEERLASLAPPPRGVGWRIGVAILVVLLLAGAAFVVLRGDRAMLEPLFDWVDRL